MKYSSLRLLTYKAVGNKIMLQKRDSNNTSYNVKIPYDEFTVIKSPIGDPDFQANEYWILKKKLYGLRR